MKLKLIEDTLLHQHAVFKKIRLINERSVFAKFSHDVWIDVNAGVYHSVYNAIIPDEARNENSVLKYLIV